MYELVLSSHTNPVLSGVAKFNQILANRLEVPCIGFHDPLPTFEKPLFISVKFKDLLPEDAVAATLMLERLRDRGTPYDLFFHTFDHLPLEADYVASARKIICANEEVREKVTYSGKPLLLGWCPGLLDRDVAKFESPLNFFSFGMAHKIQPWMHETLKAALERVGADYTLWLSTAFHEKANFGDFNSVSKALIDIYGPRVRFLGFLSDESVNYFLGKADALVAFFEKGLRSNNTSVLAALERACPVITNLDDFSPKWLRHGESVLDISKLQSTDLTAESLQTLGEKGAESVGKFASWAALVDLLTEIEPSPLHQLRENLRDPNLTAY